MRVVLSEASHAQHPVKDAGALISIDGAVLVKTDGKVAVTMQIGLIDRDMERAGHRLDVIRLVLELHLRKHVFRIEIEMAAGLPKVGLSDVRRDRELVPVLEVKLAEVILDQGSYERALGVPEDEAAADFFGMN